MMSQKEPELLQTLKCHTNDVQTLAFNNTTMVSAASDKTIRLFNSETFEELPQSPLKDHTYIVHYATFSPGGDLLASCSMDGKVYLWETGGWTRVGKLEHTSRCGVRICRFSPNGMILATGGDDNKLCIWDISCTQIRKVLSGHEESIVALAFSSESSYVISASTSGDLRVWDASYGHKKWLLTELISHAGGVTCIEVSPQHVPDEDGGVTCRVLTCGHDHLLRTWTLTGVPGSVDVHLTVCGKFEGHASVVTCCKFSPDCRLIASSSMDWTVRLWDAETRAPICCFETAERYVTCCNFSPRGDYVVSASIEIKVWRLPSCGEADSNSVERRGSVTSGGGKEAGAKALTWTAAEVQGWLQDMSLGSLGPALKDIDGAALPRLTPAVMQADLGIDAVEDRLKLRHQITRLFGTGERQRLDSGSIADEMLCPITRDVMKDPVVASDGYSYERRALQAWLDQGRIQSPMTNAPLQPNMLLPNHNLRMIIQRSHPS